MKSISFLTIQIDILKGGLYKKNNGSIKTDLYVIYRFIRLLVTGTLRLSLWGNSWVKFRFTYWNRWLYEAVKVENATAPMISKLAHCLNKDIPKAVSSVESKYLFFKELPSKYFSPPWVQKP